jgi:hypothetical protein
MRDVGENLAYSDADTLRHSRPQAKARKNYSKTPSLAKSRLKLQSVSSLKSRAGGDHRNLNE